MVHHIYVAWISCNRQIKSVGMRGVRREREGMYKGTWLTEWGATTKQGDWINCRRSSDEEHKADALALGAEEGRDKLR